MLRAVLGSLALFVLVGGRVSAQDSLHAGYEPLNDSFSLHLTEYLLPPFRRGDSTAPFLYLRVTSHRTFGCDPGLGISVHSSRDRIDVYLAGIPRDPQICSAIVEPATNTVRLPGRSGVYDLAVRRPDGTTDRYRLLVTDSLTDATPLTTHYTTLEPARRWRARRNTLSMTCILPARNGPDSTEAWVCDDFARWLRDSLGMVPFRFADGPAIPFPDAPPQQWGNVLYYKYRRRSDFRRSYALLQQFSKDHMAGRAPNAWITLTNWRGAHISSYRCRPDQRGCQPTSQDTPW